MNDSKSCSAAVSDSFTLSALIDLVNRVEKEFPVSDWKVGDIRVWPLIRWHLGWSFYPSDFMSRRSVFQRIAQRARAVIDTFVPHGYAYLFDFKNNNPLHQPADIFFLTYTRERQTISTGQQFHSMFDPLIEMFKSRNKTSTVWEMGYSNEYRIPRYSRSAFIQPWLFFISLARKRKSRRVVFEKGEDLSNFADFSSFLKANGVQQFRYSNMSLLRQDMAYIGLLADFFKKGFQKIRPLLAFSANNGLNEYALNIACRESGIVSVEIQHGVQGELHFGYGRWQNVPQEGYEMLPRFFWCWDEVSAAAINQWALSQAPSEHEAIVGGNIWLDMWLNNRNPWTQIYDRRMNDLKLTRVAEKHILMTLQPPGKTYFKGKFVSEFVLEAMEMSPSTWYWWIRFHPTMMRFKDVLKPLLERRGIKNFDMEHATKFPLPAMLRHMDVHLTHSSSTVLDAEIFGIPSVVWSPWGEELYQKQASSGIVKIAYNARDLLEAIETQFNFKARVHNETGVHTDQTLEFFLERAEGLTRWT